MAYLASLTAGLVHRKSPAKAPFANAEYVLFATSFLSFSSCRQR
jgi:hypothetical protein